MTKRTAYFTAIALTVAACGGSGGNAESSPAAAAPASTAAPATTSAPTTTTDDVEGEFCEAYRTAIAAAPSGQIEEGAMTRYADLLDEAAALAPEQHRDIIERTAEFSRGLEEDPTAPGTGEAAAELFAGMAPLAVYLQTACGIDMFGDVGGSASTDFDSVSGALGDEDAGESGEDLTAEHEAAWEAAKEFIQGTYGEEPWYFGFSYSSSGQGDEPFVRINVVSGTAEELEALCPTIRNDLDAFYGDLSYFLDLQTPDNGGVIVVCTA